MLKAQDMETQQLYSEAYKCLEDEEVLELLTLINIKGFIFLNFLNDQKVTL